MSPEASAGLARDTSDDAVLGGRLRLLQPLRGHRFGHDAILLAAATQARAGEHAVEFGAGVGAAGLALAMRCADVRVTLVEIDERLVALAQENAERNGLASRVRAIALDVAGTAAAFAAAGLPPGSADRVMMNPPFHPAPRTNVSPHAARAAAHVADGDLLGRWVKAALRLLRPGGALGLIYRADGLADVLAALSRGFGAVDVLPIHPQPGAAAIRVIVRAVSGSRAPLTLLPGLSLSDADGRPNPDVEDVMRGATELRPGR